MRSTHIIEGNLLYAKSTDLYMYMYVVYTYTHILLVLFLWITLTYTDLKLRLITHGIDSWQNREGL